MAASGAQSSGSSGWAGVGTIPGWGASLIFTAHEGDAGVPEQPGGRERWGIQGKKKGKKRMHLKNEQVNEARRASGEMEEKRRRWAVVWSDSITATAWRERRKLGYKEMESPCSLTCF